MKDKTEIDYPTEIKKLIEIEKRKGERTITLDYIKYLEEHLKLYEQGKQDTLKKVKEIIDNWIKDAKGKDYIYDFDLGFLIQKLKEIK